MMFFAVFSKVSTSGINFDINSAVFFASHIVVFVKVSFNMV